MKIPTTKVSDSAPHLTGGEALRIRKVVSVEDAAELCNVSVSFLNKCRVAGGGPTYVKFSASRRGRIGYQLDDLQRWVESKKRLHTSEPI